ncbi:hypothetical protein FE633_09205 [Streptomyces montanus]|uniref:Uncharacterized protein n=1 Tax=Streptomyces montanus TaxID=2580423 RepID=A0A5R9FX15_9ACTN|nr:hypothetical protein [Streptomyces montanus]TLS46480.1 hypothetical protein FE633_09205 [Streptomyces montanus]
MARYLRRGSRRCRGRSVPAAFAPFLASTASGAGVLVTAYLLIGAVAAGMSAGILLSRLAGGTLLSPRCSSPPSSDAPASDSLAT